MKDIKMLNMIGLIQLHVENKRGGHTLAWGELPRYFMAHCLLESI
jgi:hypothetical protein